MPQETTLSVYDQNGNPCHAITRAELGPDGRPALYDDEGYRVGWAEIPDALYWPDPEAFEPTPEEHRDGALTLANAALQRALRAAREVVWAATIDFDQDHEIPARTNHALAVLDDALTSLETIAEVPDDRSPHPLERLNRERTDAPLRGVTEDERAILAAGLAL